jgi:ribonuclease HI
MSKYHIFTDGSSRGNPGPGGWGMLVMNEEETQILFSEHDSEEHVTNNRMELKAMICALGYAESNPQHQFIIYSDSSYVVNSCNQWMRNWASNGWRNSKKQEVENVDLMKAIWSYISRPFFNVEIVQCKGHNGDLGNELADALATQSWSKYQDLVEYWDIEEPKNGEDWFPID